MAFSTKDEDNDAGEQSCANIHYSAGWFADCFHANLNAKYQLKGEQDQEWHGIIWNSWKGSKYSLRRTEMKLRPFETF